MPFSPSLIRPIMRLVRPAESIDAQRSSMMDSALPFHIAIGIIRPLSQIFWGSQVGLPSAS